MHRDYIISPLPIKVCLRAHVHDISVSTTFRLSRVINIETALIDVIDSSSSHGPISQKGLFEVAVAT